MSVQVKNQLPMRLKFKIQPFQTEAVQSVVDCFIGQEPPTGWTYRIDPGKQHKPTKAEQAKLPGNEIEEELPGWRNADLTISDEKLLENIQAVQRRQTCLYPSAWKKAPGAVATLTWKWKPAPERPIVISRQFLN